jgi:hypothetical protein
VLYLPQLREQNDLRAAFRAMGAVSPEKARPARDFPRDSAAFEQLLRRGAIREATPGTFYLYERPASPLRTIKLMLFWIIVIILPVAVIQLCARFP